ncbi:major facilitator superfamily domain-containing protein [Lanmaoa asiatica]|nr:major facilitator superfamily domain-containing protein [Lanmaoa asiatica]
MSHKVVICGAGFLGFNIAKALLTAAGGNLSRRPSCVQISSRSPEKVQEALKTTQDLDHTRLLPPHSADVTDPQSLDAAFKDADVVVSLVGLLRGTPGQFECTQWRGAENVAKTASGVGAKLIHFSAIGADVDSAVPYWRTKALGERAVFSHCPNATVFRPSIVFGPGDGFFTRFANLANVLPFMPVFDGGTTRFQPVFVGDLAHAVRAIVEHSETRGRVAGKIIEAGGPDIFTYKEMVDLVLRYTRRWRPIVSIPSSIGMLQGAVLERLPENIFTVTRDQTLQLQKDNVVTKSSKSTFSDLVVRETVERVERQEPANGCISRPEPGSETVTSLKDNRGLDPPKESDASKQEAEKPYSIYTLSEKWFIVSMASLAALFSPLTANIYLPAIPTIAIAFNKSTELINLTVTVYMVLQGVSPMLWGLLADRMGRRPIFLACLLVLSVACIGLALVPTSDYWLLMLLRCIQAAGSASTVALGAGVIGDIATRAERGSFFGLFSLGPQFGPTFGPVVGGALAQTVGWRWIFWLLCILSAGCFLTMMTFLPETLRRLVGDGSIIPSKMYRPLVPIVGTGRQKATVEMPPPPPLSNPLRILTYLDVMNLLIFNGIVYSIFYAVTATISTLFQSTYPFLNETDTGLCFLAIGGGTIIGGLITGKLMDRDYRELKEKISQESSTDPENPVSVAQAAKDENFPIEQARMQMAPFHLLVYTACCAGYGWCLEKEVNMAAPLILQIVRKFFSTISTHA